MSVHYELVEIKYERLWKGATYEAVAKGQGWYFMPDKPAALEIDDLPWKDDRLAEDCWRMTISGALPSNGLLAYEMNNLGVQDTFDSDVEELYQKSLIAYQSQYRQMAPFLIDPDGVCWLMLYRVTSPARNREDGVPERCPVAPFDLDAVAAEIASASEGELHATRRGT